MKSKFNRLYIRTLQIFLFPVSIGTLEIIFFLSTQKPCKIPCKLFSCKQQSQINAFNKEHHLNHNKYTDEFKIHIFPTQISSTQQPDSSTRHEEPLLSIRKLADQIIFNYTKQSVRCSALKTCSSFIAQSKHFIRCIFQCHLQIRCRLPCKAFINNSDPIPTS